MREFSAANFNVGSQRLSTENSEAEQPVPGTVRDEASTLHGSSEVRRRAERDIFSDILERIAQEEREAKGKEDDGEVNQPLPLSRPPNTRGTEEMGRGEEEEVAVTVGEVNSAKSPDEWIAKILSELRNPMDATVSDARRESPSPIKEVQSQLKETRDGEQSGGDKEGEAAYSKEVIGEPRETQGCVPASISPEEMTLDSNEGPIRKVVMAAEAKRKREEEEEVVPLLRMKSRKPQRKETVLGPQLLPHPLIGWQRR